MKKILFILAIVYCFSIPHTVSQIDLDDIVGAVKDGFGKPAQTTEKKDDKKVVNDLNDEVTKKLDDPKLKMLMGNFSEALNKFSNESKTGKCLQIMGAYAEVLAYCDLRAETESDPCKKKDWLGIESMILFAGTAINYCPQEFYGLSDEEADENDQTQTYMEYDEKIKNYFWGYVANTIAKGFKLYGIKDIQEIKHMYSDDYILTESEYKKYCPQCEIKYTDLTYETKKFITDLVRYPNIDDYDENLDSHFLLYKKFYATNKQLGIVIPKDQGNMVDFVGKMFTPEFLVKKTLEIANENGKLKCIPK
ncbi:hypothetical protein [Tenacibaculum aestuarii]|uniref:hypothetical protein n=1 Tax=Tenacibaculum aestuarii TaxID=362781 RepID=UPI0038942D1D